MAVVVDEEKSEWQHRLRLPVPMFARNDYSIWSILKHCIGKELSKITFPIIFNEPLSFLQRMSEYMEYAYLLKEANQQHSPVERIQYVAAFAVSALAANWERIGKPFNPLLGETYELERDDYHLICEQVSHHPPISAFHAHSPDFIFHGSIQPKLKFWGKSVEIQPKGIITVELRKHGEAYTWSNVNCCIHNIIVGKLWIEQYGVLEVVNHKTNMKCTVNFKPAGWFSKDLHKKQKFLYGKWTDFIKSVDIESYDDYIKTNPQRLKTGNDTPRSTPGSSPAHSSKKSSKHAANSGPSNSNGFDESQLEDPEEPIPKNTSVYSLDIPNSVTLWEATPRPHDSEQYYQFTQFAMTLNEMEHKMVERLCPTDCRYRPDIRKLEEGDIDGAAEEKTRLEEKQRDAKKGRKVDKDNWKPRWFQAGPNSYTKDEDWNYIGGYWDKKFSNIPDIF
uniref:Oxysterol-binding protein n=1 Tax=Strigamia maritima TaxID=126957 RepID=T1JB46_STRMM